ncbi:hypothetical protein C0995_015882 [Termitomyces sp. Mi166|nr:hypothetical protein C0995_015882 [Termitomyces sp. Mi166\
MVHFTPLFIGEEQKFSGPTYDVINPASGLVVGQSVNATAEDCKAAVDAAATAFETWQHSTVAERRAIFLKAAELVETDKYKNMILQASQEETATLDAWPALVWGVASNTLRQVADLSGGLKGRILPSITPGGKLEILRKPIGVILSIAPWNAPLGLTLRGVMIPIVCGNTVVIKSSERSPRSQAIVFELFREAGLPSGVLNVVSCSSEDAAARTEELISHTALRKITVCITPWHISRKDLMLFDQFTGSEEIGRIIAKVAANYLKPCILELGGKAPVIVLDDAAVTAAAESIAISALLNAGQICMSAERVIVQAGVAPVLINAVRAVCQSFVGKVGPLINEASAERIVQLVKDAVNSGAELLLGDLTRERATVQPHLVKLPFKGSETGKDIGIWEKESFGPVFVVVDTIDEAIQLANTSNYSLTAAVWTNDLYVAKDVSERVRAGFINVNGATVHSELTVDGHGLGGASGYGRFDVNAFTDSRIVVTHGELENTTTLVFR